MESSIGLVETFMDQTDIEQFHNNLKAALIADIPLVGGKDHRLTLSELDNLQQQLDAVLHDSQQLAGQPNPTTWHDDRLPKWYRAALTVFDQTASTLPVLEGLSPAIGR